MIHSFPWFLPMLGLCLQLIYKENEETYTYKTSYISHENSSFLSFLICIIFCGFKCTVILPTFVGGGREDDRKRKHVDIFKL